jgi:hypothetical protein
MRIKADGFKFNELGQLLNNDEETSNGYIFLLLIYFFEYSSHFVFNRNDS